MGKPIRAEYDAAKNALNLEEKPDGIRDHQRVSIAIDEDESLISAALALSEESLSRAWDNPDDSVYDDL